MAMTSRAADAATTTATGALRPACDRLARFAAGDAPRLLLLDGHAHVPLDDMYDAMFQGRVMHVGQLRRILGAGIRTWLGGLCMEHAVAVPSNHHSPLFTAIDAWWTAQCSTTPSVMRFSACLPAALYAWEGGSEERGGVQTAHDGSPRSEDWSDLELHPQGGPTSAPAEPQKSDSGHGKRAPRQRFKPSYWFQLSTLEHLDLVQWWEARAGFMPTTGGTHDETALRAPSPPRRETDPGCQEHRQTVRSGSSVLLPRGHPCAARTPLLLVLRRGDYKAHLRHSGRVSERVSNMDAVVAGLRRWATSVAAIGAGVNSTVGNASVPRGGNVAPRVRVLVSTMHELSLARQLRLVRDACLFVGVHGAAMTHPALFGTPGTVALELQPPSHRLPMFQKLSTFSRATTVVPVPVGDEVDVAGIVQCMEVAWEAVQRARGGGEARDCGGHEPD